MTTAPPLDRIPLPQLLDALGEGVLVVLPSGEIVGMNPAFRATLEIERAPRTVAELRDLLQVRTLGGEPITDESSPLLAALRGRPSSGRYRVRRTRGGTDAVVDAATSPIRGPDGRVAAAVMALHDVTPAAEAEREREEFLSLVSHELKTPLTPLKALAQLLRARVRRSREGTTALDMDSLDRNLATIERQVDRMNAVVNDLLEVSRAGRGTFELHMTEFDLARCVRDLVRRYTDATAEEGRHRFALDAPASLEIKGDEPRLEQALWDLIGNAVKFSPRGGEVHVRLASEGPSAIVTITDEGIGIAPDELAAVGTRAFVRGAGKAATFPGMGLGVYFSRMVASGHGGTLDLLSEGEGKGTTVRLMLPTR